ncbi:SRPBCC family protein [Azospirillum sp. B4]|uniref:SRPBCC family protein n=1 Tax=Azospirillum sp. B4 TaxID=95605 RepID=UPI000346AD43|nr:SRPBCC family protein [Azospirillum sp. B4]
MSNAFVYVTYIRTTPDKLWRALTDNTFMRLYWLGCEGQSDWQPGSPWRLVNREGQVMDTGEVLEAAPPFRLVLKWRNEFRPELNAEGYSRCAFEIEPLVDTGIVKLSITHTMEQEGGAKFIQAVSGGWPLILSNLKSLLETGEVLAASKAQFDTRAVG